MNQSNGEAAITGVVDLGAPGGLCEPNVSKEVKS